MPKSSIANYDLSLGAAIFPLDKPSELEAMRFRKLKLFASLGNAEGCLVGKCSATRYNVAAPPRDRVLEGPCTRDTPPRWQRERCDRGLWRRCSCDTPAAHSELRNEPRQGCSYTVERDRGGCSVCPTKEGCRNPWVLEPHSAQSLVDFKSGSHGAWEGSESGCLLLWGPHW